MGCIALVRCVLVLRCGLAVVVWYPYNTTHEITQQISRKLVRMDVLTSETCWALNNEIIKQGHQFGLSLFKYQDDARSNKHNMIRFLASYTDASFSGDNNLLHFTNLRTDDVPYTSRIASSCNIILNLLLLFLP